MLQANVKRLISVDEADGWETNLFKNNAALQQ